jgi:hypothetical protein
MSRLPAARTPDPQPVEVEIFQQPVIGMRNPPCCGRACVPKLIRTKRLGETTRLADGDCPLCGHRLRITYARRGDEWHPIAALDLNRQPCTIIEPEKDG